MQVCKLFIKITLLTSSMMSVRTVARLKNNSLQLEHSEKKVKEN